MEQGKKVFIGVSEDSRSGLWRYRLHKRQNKNPTSSKAKYNSDIQAAFAREARILTSIDEYDTDNKANTRNFSDEEYKRLKNVNTKSLQLPNKRESKLFLDNPEVKIVMVE